MFRQLSTQHIICQNSKATICGNIGKHFANQNNSRLYHDMSRVTSNNISNFNVGQSSLMPKDEKKLRFADILLWNHNQQQSRQVNAKELPPPAPVEDKNRISKLVIPKMLIPEDPQIKQKPINSRPFKIETYVGNTRRTENIIQMSPPKKQTRSRSNSHSIRPVYHKEQDNEIVRDQLMNWIRLESEDERIKYFIKKSEQIDKQLEETITMQQGNFDVRPQYEFEPRQQRVQSR